MSAFKTAGILSCCAVDSYDLASGASPGPVVKVFQAALGVEATGEFDSGTVAAMQAYQVENGLEVTQVPDAGTLAALEVPVILWIPVVLAAGGSRDEVEAAATEARKIISVTIADSMQETFSDEE